MAVWCKCSGVGIVASDDGNEDNGEDVGEEDDDIVSILLLGVAVMDSDSEALTAD